MHVSNYEALIQRFVARILSGVFDYKCPAQSNFSLRFIMDCIFVKMQHMLLTN